MATEDIRILLIALHPVRIDVAGIAILFDKNGYRICEANSSPGFQALEPACNINVPEIIFNAMQIRLGAKVRRATPIWRRILKRAKLRGTKTPRVPISVPAE